MSVDWLYFRWWLDSEDRIWIWHDCAGVERIEPLPLGKWTVNIDTGGVEPSVDCRACGKHAVMGMNDTTQPPASWTDLDPPAEEKPR